MEKALDNLEITLTEEELEELLADLPDFIRELEESVA
ncbi:hypothetical protein SPX_42050 [Sporomusa paucivorans]